MVSEDLRGRPAGLPLGHYDGQLRDHPPDETSILKSVVDTQAHRARRHRRAISAARDVRAAGVSAAAAGASAMTTAAATTAARATAGRRARAAPQTGLGFQTFPIRILLLHHGLHFAGKRFERAAARR